VIILRVSALSKHFGGISAVNNVSFEVGKGEILGLIGPNGSGKTTLFNLISGLYRPDSGRIIFMGEDITKKQPHEICRKGIARTFQLVRAFPNMTVLENVVVGSIFGGGIKDLDVALNESRRICEFVGLAGKEDTPVRNLTAVDKKLTELARALAMKPKLLLIDELMAGLNPVETEQAMALLKRIREQGITIFWIEHMIKAVVGISDRIMVMNHGMKIAEGRPDEVVNDVRVIEVYLGGRW